MKKALFVILAALALNVQAQEKILSINDCMDTVSALNRTAATIQFYSLGGLYKKDGKIVEIRCSVDVRVPGTVKIYTESEYADLLNQKEENYQRQVALRAQKDLAKLKALGF